MPFDAPTTFVKLIFSPVTHLVSTFLLLLLILLLLFLLLIFLGLPVSVLDSLGLVKDIWRGLG